MSLINVEINKDSNGFPTNATLIRNGRRLDVFYNPDGKITFNGRMHEDFKPILQMIWPFEKEVEIKEPLLVKSDTQPFGNTLLFDDMETLLKWEEGAVTVALDNTFAYNGNQSLQLTCAAVNNFANASRYFPYPLSSKLELSFKFAVDDLTKLFQFQLYLTFSDISRMIQTVLIYDPTAWLINIGAANVEIFNLDVAEEVEVGGPWHYVKALIDLERLSWISLQVDNKKAELHTPLIVGAGAANNAIIELYVNNVAGNDVNMWFDDVLIKEVN